MDLTSIDRGRSTMRWSVVVRDAETGRPIVESHPTRVLRAASIGKLVLLGYTGYVLQRDPQLATKRLDRRTVAPIADSGVWQHLASDSLTVPDIATLIFLSSDNLGTNVLLEHFGVDEVRRFGTQLGLEDTVLFDLVREVRGPGAPETLSVSSAAELSDFMSRLWRRAVLDPSLSDWMLIGLSKSMDLSMIPQVLGLDPLAHDGPTAAPGVANKTGTDDGIRADAGLLCVGSSVFAYAVICNYEPDSHTDVEVLASMREIGSQMVQVAGQGRRADASTVRPGSSRPAGVE